MFNKLYKSRVYPLLIQVVSLIVFALLVILGFGISTEDVVFAKQLRNTNLSNLVVWSYWWPFIVITAVLFGRHWCSICPIELVSTITEKVGLKKKVPTIFKSGWIITILYAFIAIIAIHTWGIHRIPHLTALYLLSLFGLAILVSLIYEKRAFCSYFCPVGKLLGMYSLLSSKGLRISDANICKKCKAKDCIAKNNQRKFIGRSCTSGLYPATIKDNRDCILCTQCVKACPNDNIKMQGPMKSFEKFEPDTLRWSEVGMIAILMGFISYEIMSSWSISKKILLLPGDLLYSFLNVDFIPKSTFEATVLFILFPLCIIMLFSGLHTLWGKHSYGFNIKRAVVYLLPIIAFGHVLKALMKSTSRFPYWEYALSKPDGIDYAQALVDKQVFASSIGWVDNLAVILGVTGLAFAFIHVINKLRMDAELSTGGKISFLLFVLMYFFFLLIGPVSMLFVF